MLLRRLLFALIILPLGAAALPASGQPAPPPEPEAATPSDPGTLTSTGLVGGIAPGFARETRPLVLMERDFCRMAGEKGIRAAFIHYLAPDGILFRPGPVAGREWFEGRPETPGARLLWDAAYAEISASGDLGWTTGPWSYRATPTGPTVGHGSFFTVWRKQADGSWRAAIDHGIEHAAPEQARLVGKRVGGAAAKGEALAKDALEAARNGLEASERAYTQALAEQGLAAALASHAAADVQVARNGRTAVVGATAAGPRFGAEWEGRSASWTPGPVTVSAAGDLGFTYGTVRAAAKVKGGDAPADEQRAYVHVWRREEGAWKLALDLMTPFPPPAPAASTAPEAGTKTGAKD